MAMGSKSIDLLPYFVALRNVHGIGVLSLASGWNVYSFGRVSIGAGSDLLYIVGVNIRYTL